MLEMREQESVGRAESCLRGDFKEELRLPLPPIIAVIASRMSGIGTKRTCPVRHIMSVLGGKADIKDAVSDFRS